MTRYAIGKYCLDIYIDHTFIANSNESKNQYDFVYFKNSEYLLSTVLGLKVFRDDSLIKTIAIGSTGGKTNIHENSIIAEKDRLVVCCSDTIFCISIPDLTLLWQTQADKVTCFAIYKYHNSYIVHGELEISRLDVDGKILWRQSGADIFTTLDGKNSFVITDSYISVTDWNNRKYKFDFNGTIIR
jgi:hypothetical protein